RAWPAALAAQRGQFRREVGAWVGIALDAPAGPARCAAAAAALDAERLVREVGAEPVEADLRQLAGGGTRLGQRAFQIRDVRGRLLVGGARRVDGVPTVKP